MVLALRHAHHPPVAGVRAASHVVMNAQRKIVIPGGAGLVGQNLVVQLKRRGFTNLVVLDKHAENLAVLRRLHPELVAECVDLADEGAWQAHFAGAASVVMLQAQIGALESAPLLRNNLVATERVLEAMRRHGVTYLVHVSSSVVNSVAKDDYTTTKRAQEDMVLASGIESIVL